MELSAWSNAPRLQLARLSELYVMWYLVAPPGASQVAVSEPSARVRVMFETLPGAPCARESLGAMTIASAAAATSSATATPTAVNLVDRKSFAAVIRSPHCVRNALPPVATRSGINLTMACLANQDNTKKLAFG